MTTTAIKERPILFSPRLVRAILDGRKTQTRRVVRWKPYDADCAGINFNFSGLDLGHYFTGHPDTGWVLRSRGAGGCWNDRTKPAHSPYGQPGDRLWVRETWSKPFAGPRGYIFRADGPEFQSATGPLAHQWGAEAPWKPSIHMPREACRLRLEITGVRVERLQEISEADAKAEGVKIHVDTEGCPPGKGRVMFPVLSPYASKERMTADHAYRWEYASLWDDINKGRGFGWDANPWVWVIEFKRVEVGR